MSINHRNNMIAALECRQPTTAVPIWELEFQSWDNVSGKHVILGTEFTKLSSKEQEIAINNNAEIMINVSKELGFSALSMINSFWEIAPGHPSYYWLPEDLKKKQNALLQKYCKEEKIATVGSYGALVTMPGSGDGYEEFCYKLYDEPEEVDAWAKNMYEKGIESAKWCRDMGYDIILSPSDVADNKGPFYSPAQMERWFYPYLNKWAEEVKTMGMYTILHTDGNISPLLDKLADSPLHAIQAIDTVAGMDIFKTKEQVSGRLCLCGNVGTGTLVLGPKEAVYEETKQILLNCKAGGGLVLGASNATVPETPAENYREIYRAWKEFGMY